jgi:site-specific DNA-methyltransferase (adenine-specific)/modification methylase
MWNKGHVWNFTTQVDMHNFIQSPVCAGRERLRNPRHPTQKPLAVLRRLIGLASRPGDVVLDPFMGVGSTGVAAVESGRRFVGIEIDETYLAAADRRLAATTPPLIEGEESTSCAHVTPWPTEERSALNRGADAPSCSHSP